MFSFLQGSRFSSVPVHLYEVVYGADERSRIRLTDAEEPQTFGGHVYQVSQIKHSEIHASGTLDKTTLTVSTRFDSPLSELFRHYPPSQVVTLTVYRGELNDPDNEFYVVWSGRVLSCALEDYEAKLTCEPVGTGVRRPGLRRNFQLGCPHVLYGPSCRANREAFSSTASVLNTTGASVRLPPGWNAGWSKSQFINGMAEWSDELGNTVTRTILQVAAVSGSSDDVILVAGNLAGLCVGRPIKLSLGCNHQMSNCSQVFGNMPNFGGCPWIPTKNPVGSYNPFY